MTTIELVNVLKQDCLVMIGMKPIRTVLGLVSYTSSEDEYVVVPCIVSEEKYTLKDNYKVTLIPIDKKYSKEHFYTSDLLSLINKSQAKIYINYNIQERRKICT